MNKDKIQIGQRYKNDYGNGEYVLCTPDGISACLVHIDTGLRWKDAIPVVDRFDITKEEFGIISGGNIKWYLTYQPKWKETVKNIT